MDIIAAILGGLRIIIGFFLLLFVPGFAISLIYFPDKTDIPLVERLIYSTVLSIGSVIVLVLVMDLILGIYTTPRNILIIIYAFSGSALIVWLCVKGYQDNELFMKLDSRLSSSYTALRRYIRNTIKKN